MQWPCEEKTQEKTEENNKHANSELHQVLSHYAVSEHFKPLLLHPLDQNLSSPACSLRSYSLSHNEKALFVFYRQTWPCDAQRCKPCSRKDLSTCRFLHFRLLSDIVQIHPHARIELGIQCVAGENALLLMSTNQA